MSRRISDALYGEPERAPWWFRALVHLGLSIAATFALIGLLAVSITAMRLAAYALKVIFS